MPTAKQDKLAWQAFILTTSIHEASRYAYISLSPVHCEVHHNIELLYIRHTDRQMDRQTPAGMTACQDVGSPVQELLHLDEPWPGMSCQSRQVQ